MLLGRNMCELLRLPVEASVSYNRCKIKCIDDNLKPQDAAGKKAESYFIELLQ